MRFEPTPLWFSFVYKLTHLRWTSTNTKISAAIGPTLVFVFLKTWSQVLVDTWLKRSKVSLSNIVSYSWCHFGKNVISILQQRGYSFAQHLQTRLMRLITFPTTNFRYVSGKSSAMFTFIACDSLSSHKSKMGKRYWHKPTTYNLP